MVQTVNSVTDELTADFRGDGIQQRTGPGPALHSNPD